MYKNSNRIDLDYDFLSLYDIVCAVGGVLEERDIILLELTWNP